MAQKDTATKLFFQENPIFADVFDILFFQGEGIVKPENLRQKNPEQLNLIKSGKGLASEVRIRDLLKACICRQDGANSYFLLGLEGQSSICPFMPLRMLDYDVREYESQVRDGSMKANGGLTPVLSLVINLGERPWEGAVSIGDLYRTVHPKIRSLLPDYPMRLLDPHRMTDGEIENFSKEVQYVFKAVKYGKDKRKLADLFFGQGKNVQVRPSTVECVAALLGVSIDAISKQEGGKLDMCTAMQELKAEWEEAAKEQGHKEGLEQGVFRMLRNLATTCLARGMSQGEASLLIKSVAQNPNLDVAQFFLPEA